LDLTLLANQIDGVVTHYVVSDESGVPGTRVCTQHEEGGCPIHDERLEWAGFVPVWAHHQRKRAVLRLAPLEARTLLRVLGTDVNWAGLRVVIKPENSGDGRVIRVERYRDNVGAAQMAPHAIRATMCLILGCARIPRQSPIDPQAQRKEGDR